MSDERGKDFGETASFSSLLNKGVKKKEVSSSIDRLSELPDALLIHILSYLGTDKAAATTVLSKRWQYLWTELPELDFRDSSTDIEERRKLVTRVHRALVHCTANYLEGFGVHFAFDECFVSDVEDMELDEDVIRKILSGCPVLRSLRLTGCWGFERLDIESPSLHHLMIEGCEEEDLMSGLLELSAPYIRVLIISPFLLGSKKYRITNTPSLITAGIQFDTPEWGVSEEEIIDTMEFFEEIKHVKKLTLGCECIDVLCKLVEGGRQLPESTRECLIVEARRNEDTISGIVVLLESSPKLETLVIQCFGRYEDEDAVDTWGPVFRGDLACDLLNLKTVTLRNFADPYDNGPNPA